MTDTFDRNRVSRSELHEFVREVTAKLEERDKKITLNTICLEERDKENIRLRKRVERLEQLGGPMRSQLCKLEEKTAEQKTKNHKFAKLYGMSEQRYEQLQQPLAKLDLDAKKLDMLASSTDHHLKRLERRVDHLEEQKNYLVGSTPICPTCKQYMTLKENNTTGDKFWGCMTFPNCYGTRDFPDATKDRGRKIKEVIGPATTHGTFHSPNETWQCKRIR